jgi:RHS repeat-associated protein
METNNTGIVQAVYTYGKDLISMKRTDANSYYLYDGLGSVRQLANSAGVVVTSYTYDAFGNKIASSGSITNPYDFTGEQQFDEADNLVFLRARYYKPSIGRFISRDSIRYKGGINLYAYVKNNPIKLVDPYGLYPWGDDWDVGKCVAYCYAMMMVGAPTGCGAETKKETCEINCHNKDAYPWPPDDDFDPWPPTFPPPPPSSGDGNVISLFFVTTFILLLILKCLWWTGRRCGSCVRLK